MGRKRAPKKSYIFGLGLIVAMGIVMLVLVSVLFYKALHSNPTNADQASRSAVPVYYNRAQDAMPFPITLEPGIFKRPDVYQAYKVAKEIPGILAQQPCYCYCQRKGHRGLLDCFKTDHAASCSICIKEALVAGEMRRQGKSSEEIRSAIIQDQPASAKDSSQ
jgi:hypothetical protein